MLMHMLTRGIMLVGLLGLWMLTGWLSSAEAVLTIRSAAVVNGVAVVEGGNAPRAAPISWEGSRVTQANNGGNFAFQAVVPADCVGRLEDGVPADAIDVALANCTPPQPAEFPAPVPRSGQTMSYATGDDGNIQAGIEWPTPRFTDNGDGTVTDNLTGLIWLKDASCLGTHKWEDTGPVFPALAVVADLNAGVDFLCANYTVGTFTDWRLPNVKELQSLIDFGHGALPIGHPFSGVQSTLYWSSTTYAGTPVLAWVVYLSGGLPSVNVKDDTGLVWPVRGPE